MIYKIYFIIFWAAFLPSLAAFTTSELPLMQSPPAKTPVQLVLNSLSTKILPFLSVWIPFSAKNDKFSTSNPRAKMIMSASTLNSLPFIVSTTLFLIVVFLSV